VRPGDVVVTRRGEYAGAVTSCSIDVEGYQLGLAYLHKRHAREGTELRVFPLPEGEKTGPEKDKKDLTVGDRVAVAEEAFVLPRFPVKGEKQEMVADEAADQATPD
jgi:hypothetical protein